MNFDESVSYLLSLGNEVLTMKLGLENITKLLAALDNPQNNYLKIQVAGTNGKGSTCAFLDSICVRAGINTGLYTSPHLVSITERIRIGGIEISEKDFARLATKVRNVSEEMVENYKFQIENPQSAFCNLHSLETVPTFFEQITVIALSAFAEAEVELAILETGLGGRFDATTATKAEIAAITPIDLDHQEYLGETLAEIAAEKAAIIREDTKVVVSDQKRGALEVILKRCAEKNVVPVFNKCQFIEENRNKYFFQTKRRRYFVSELGLKGEHQRQNACTAINLAEVLIEDFKFEISDQAFTEGLENAEHKGRLEWMKTGGAEFLFDGAHNIAGAKALAKYLEKTERKFTLIFGAMKDKDLPEIAAILFPLAENLILTMPDNPRSFEVEDLNKYSEKFIDKSKIFLVPDVADALDAAIQMNSTRPATENSFICATGSLYLVGEAQRVLREKD